MKGSKGPASLRPAAVILSVVLLVLSGCTTATVGTLAGERWTGVSTGGEKRKCVRFVFDIVINVTEGKVGGKATTDRGRGPAVWEVTGSVGPHGSVSMRTVTKDPRIGLPYAYWAGQLTETTLEIAQPSSVHCDPPRSATLERIVASGSTTGSGIAGELRAGTMSLSKQVVEPPADAVKADIGFPSVGTKWVTKTVSHTGIAWTITHTVLDEGTYKGTPVYRVSDGVNILMFDKATRNWIAAVRAGTERAAASPYHPLYSFPLWVGKSWVTNYNYYDGDRERTFFHVPWRAKVTAYEDVTVPAGTFKAFKLEGGDPGGRIDV